MAAPLLKLVFPQWQGSGNRQDTYYGAKYIRDHLLNGSRYEEVPVTLDEIQLENGLKGHRQILRQLKDASALLGSKNPAKIFLIGGDCGTEVGPISYLNKRYGGDLAVIWFDAHGDLNSPETSASHNFHGMPLRLLLGEGEAGLRRECPSLLTPSQVIMAGVRELDPPEDEFIREKSIKCVSVDQLKSDSRCLSEIVKARGYHNVYAHIDLDVLYPEKYPWVQCPTDGGLDMSELLAQLTDLKNELNLVGISMLELRPTEKMDVRPLQELVRFCNEI